MVLATLHEGTQEGADTAHTYLVLTVVSGALAILGCLYWAALILSGTIFRSWPGQHGFIYLIGLALISKFAEKMYHEYRAHHAGIRSKEKGVEALEELPDSYHVFTNVRLDERSTLDAVAVGENGVFLVLMKGMNGEIEPSRGKTWTQHKVGREDTPYENEIRSPLPKLTALTHVLKEYLEENGVKAWIDGSVLFTKARLLEPVDRCYTYESDLRRHITSFQPRFPLRAADRDKIIELLEDCVE